MDTRIDWPRIVIVTAAAGLVVVLLVLNFGGRELSGHVQDGRDGVPDPAAKGNQLQLRFAGVPLFPGRQRDEIQPIDHPVFAAAPPNTASLSDEDWVVGVTRGGVSRAYPLWVLSRREIVNDWFGSEPICVTYCPVSASVVAFLARTGDGEAVFGNEGALYEGNLVMYDRGTGSLWYQLRGEAIHGPQARQTLSMIPAALIRWGEWRKRHPEGVVLVADGRTGRFFRVVEGAFGAGQAQPGVPEAPVSRLDPRLPAMERVLGYRGPGWEVCLPVKTLEGLPAGRYAMAGAKLGEEGIWLERGEASGIRVVTSDGTEVPAIPAYWFAWHAAFPSGRVVSNLSNP